MSNIPITPVLGEDPFSVLEDNRRAIDSLRVSMAEAPARRGRDWTPTLPRPRGGRWLRALGGMLLFGAATAAAAAAGGVVGSKRKNKLWYRALRKPALTPPDRVFSVVWPVLYGLTAASGYRVFRSGKTSLARTAALALWGTQLALNAAWSPTFFGAHKPRLAFKELLGNAASLGAYTAIARRVDRPAAWMMAPYLGWLGFAGYLNHGIVAKNGWLRG